VAVARAGSILYIYLATINPLFFPVPLTRSPRELKIFVAKTSPRDVIEAEYSTELAQDGG
jgi:hypothetical protein